MPHILPITFLDFLIIIIMTGGLYAFATWGLSDDEEDESADKIPEQKIACDIEDHNEAS